MPKICRSHCDRESFRVCGMSLLSAYALTADFAVFVEKGMDIPQSRIVYYFLEQLRGSIVGKGGILTILAVAMMCLYRKADHYVNGTRRRGFILCAVALSLCTLVHYPYEIAGSISLTCSTWFQVVKCLFFLAGYTFLFYYGISVLYQYIKQLNLTCNSTVGGAESIARISAF